MCLFPGTSSVVYTLNWLWVESHFLIIMALHKTTENLIYLKTKNCPFITLNASERRKYFSKDLETQSWQCTAWLHITMKCFTCNCSLLFLNKWTLRIHILAYKCSTFLFMNAHFSEPKTTTRHKIPILSVFHLGKCCWVDIVSMLRCNHTLHIVHDYARCV